MKSEVIINCGLGVNSVAILAMLCRGELEYKNPVIAFADTGAEYPETYQYRDYINPILREYGYEIITTISNEGSLWDYCNNKKILPMRTLRWCTDRWKRKPLELLRGDIKAAVIGIDHGEAHRADRWINDPNALFPLIEYEMNRDDCISVIRSVGWKIPNKSGCWFCPYEKMRKFKELKINHRELFNTLCVLEIEVLNRLKDTKIEGWYDPHRPLSEAIDHRYPECADGQQSLCMYCMA